MAEYGEWYIGSSTGSHIRGVRIQTGEICAENIGKANGFGWDGSKWIELKNFSIQCADHVKCFCKKLDISGFDIQANRNGLYTSNNSTLNGRNRFRHKVVAFTISDINNLPYINTHI